MDDGSAPKLIEAKSGRTVASDAFRALDRWEQLIGPLASGEEPARFLIHGGETRRRRADLEVLPWQMLAGVEW